MTTERATEMELLSQGVNAAVVRVPGRRFPGLVLQGDSLSILVDDAAEIRRMVSGHEPLDRPELEAAAESLEQKLAEYLAHYEAVLQEHGLPLPYVKKESSRKR